SGSSSNVMMCRTATAPPTPSVAAVSDNRLPRSKHAAKGTPPLLLPVHVSARAGAAIASIAASVRANVDGHCGLRPSRCGRLGAYVLCSLAAGFSPQLAALRACALHHPLPIPADPA